jgi:hypothetical protein
MSEKENRKIKLVDKEISYSLKTSRLAKNIRLSINCLGEVVLTRPRFLSIIRAEEFLKLKKDWLLKKIEFFQNHKDSFSETAQPLTRREYLFQRAGVEKLIRERLAYFNNFYKFSYNRVSVRNQKTRWGSCSRRGALNFNVRLGSLPGDLQDYIIVHELCHLKEFNHSSSFWSLLAKQIPDFKERRKKLKNIKLL